MKEQTVLTKAEWLSKGQLLFGDDPLKWKFVCPSCGNIQTPEDFRKYKDVGATPNTAYFNCIGRYDGHEDVDMCSGKSPCNYSGGGLFGLNPITVIDGDKQIHVFAFNEVKEVVK
jgi:hypothetical protein